MICYEHETLFGLFVEEAGLCLAYFCIRVWSGAWTDCCDKCVLPNVYHIYCA